MKTFRILMVLVLVIACVAALIAESAIAEEEWICPKCQAVSTGNFCSNCGEARPTDKSKPYVAFKQNDVSMIKGKNVRLEPTVENLDKTVKAGKNVWSSSDKTVATCENGTVRAVGAGTAVITCTNKLSDGTEAVGQCNITVTVPINQISVTKRDIKIGVGESVSLDVTIKPEDASNKGLVYTSSDDNVVTVDDNGTITGIGVGKATIKVVAADESGKSVSINVTTYLKDDIGVTKIDSRGIKYTLTKVTESKGNSFMRPESGNVFVMTEFEIENNTNDDLTVSTMLDFDGYCDGYSCNSSMAGTVTSGHTLDATIAPGKKLRGEVGFEVPSNWKELEVDIKLDIWSGERVKFIAYKH